MKINRGDIHRFIRCRYGLPLLLVLAGLLPLVTLCAIPVPVACSETQLSISAHEDKRRQAAPDLPNNTLYAASLGTAVGAGGTILSRYEDKQWVSYWYRQESPTSNTLNAVSMVSGDCGVAVGDHGTIVSRCLGSPWQIETSPVTRTLTSVSMISVNYGTMVGEEGIILSRVDGNPWHVESSPTTNTLHSVSMLSADCGVAVGANGTILSRCHGAPWQAERSPTTTTLYSVAMASISSGKAVGEDGIILTYVGDQGRASGQRWGVEKSPTTNTLYSVKLVRGQGYWAVGEHGTILFYPFYGENHDTWLLVDSPTQDTIHSVYAIGGWVIPHQGAVGVCGMILDDSSGTWQMVNDPFCASLDKHASPQCIVSKRPVLTYTVALTGPGENLRLWDPLPNNTVYIPGSLTGTVTPPASYSPTDRAVIWEGDVPADTVQTITFQVIPDIPSPLISIPVVNTAQLTDTVTGKNISATAIVGWCSGW